MPQRRRPDDRDGDAQPGDCQRRPAHRPDARRPDRRCRAGRDRGQRMSAWWSWVGHDARRRWASAVLLVVLLAVGGGVVLSAFVGARRDATAVERLLARVRPSTAMALPNEPGFDWR